MSDKLKSFFFDLDRFSYRGVKPGLERIRAALDLLGRPEKSFRVVHVAGTNGKGSVSSLIAQFLAVSGHAVGLSLSPHIFDYRERMQFYAPDPVHPRATRPEFIPEDELLAIHADLLRRVPDALGLTYFEWSIALALEFFARRGLEFAVLETGMGGRWDATNACDSMVSAITSIGLDHVRELGPTPKDILNEKLQIAKPGSDFLFGPRNEALIAQAKAHCASVGARFHHVDDFRRDWEKAWDPNRPLFAERPSYYLENFRLAYALACLLKERGIRIDLAALPALETYHLPPARYQTVSDAPRILVDGAHNEHALKNLKSFLDRDFPQGYDLVFGCLSDRNFAELAGLIVPRVGRRFWALFDAGPRTPVPETYSAAMTSLGGEIVRLDEAFLARIRNAERPVIVCGSLYLCSQFLALWRAFVGADPRK